MLRRLINTLIFLLLLTISNLSMDLIASDEVYVGYPYTSSYGYYLPYYYPYSVTEFIVHKDELGSVPRTLENMSFLVYSMTRSSTWQMGDVSIYIRHTTDSILTAGTYSENDLANYTLVWGEQPLDIRGWYREWKTFMFDSPFEYNGKDHIKILMRHRNTASVNAYYYYATTYVYGRGNLMRSGYSSNMLPPTSYSSVYTYRPFIVFNRPDGAPYNWTPISDSEHALACLYSPRFSGGSTTSLYMNYNAGATECIYTPNTLGNKPRRIDKIRWYTYSRSGSVGDKSYPFRLYLKNSDIISLGYGSTSGLTVDSTGYTKVFEGSYTLTNQYGCSWIDIDLDTPFYYDGSSNLHMLHVIDAGNIGYRTGYYNFYTFYCPTGTLRYTYSTYYPNWNYGNYYLPVTDFVGPELSFDNVVCDGNNEIEVGWPYTSSYGYYFPYYSYRYSVTEFVVHKNELQNTPQLIKTLAMLKNSMGLGRISYGDVTMKNVSIFMKQSIDSTLSTSTSPSSGTIVNGSRINAGGPVDTSAASGYVKIWGTRDLNIGGGYDDWLVYNLDTPFDYDGTSHIKILIMYDRDTSISVNNYYYYYTSYFTGGPVCRYAYNNNYFPTSWNGTFYYRPYIVFNKALYNANNSVETRMWQNKIKGDTVEILTHPTTSGGSTTSFYLYSSIPSNYTNRLTSEILYTASALGGKPRMISKIAFLVYSRSGSVGQQSNPFELYLKNTTRGCLYSGSNQYIDLTDYKKVFTGNYILQDLPSGSWLELTLDEPFYYDGESDIGLIFQPLSGTNYNYNYYTFATYYKFSYAMRYATSYSYAYYNTNNSYTPCIKFIGNEVPPRHTYVGSVATQFTGRCPSGSKDVPILGLKVSTRKVFAPFITMNSIEFDGKMSVSNNQVLVARCYYTYDDEFSTENQYGEPIIVTRNNVNSLVFSDNIPLAKSTYFWLAYDIAEVVPEGIPIDASVTRFILGQEGEETIYTPRDADPGGNKTVHSPLLKDIYTVGMDENADYSKLSTLALDYTELGIKQDITIRVITDIIDDSVAYFGVNPFKGDYKIKLVPYSDNSTITITAGRKLENSYLELHNCHNFTIDGDKNKLSIVAPNGCIKLNNSNNFTITSTNLAGYELKNVNSNGITLLNSSNININNNNIGSCYEGINIGSSRDLIINNNELGDVSNLKTVTTGLTLKDVSGLNLSLNRFINLYSDDYDVIGLKIIGSSPDDMRLNIINNTFNSLSSNKGDVIGILLDNAHGVSILHNTVYIYRNSIGNTLLGYLNSSVLYESTPSSSINLCNNVFYNSLGGGEVDAIFYTNNTNLSNPFKELRGNVYYSFKSFAANSSLGTLNFGEWKSYLNALGLPDGFNELNSYWYDDLDSTGVHTFTLLSSTDCHLDGPATVDPGFFVPVHSSVLFDIDGESRGSGYTTSGSDHVDLYYLDLETDYPSSAYDSTRESVTSLDLCDNSRDELFLQYEKEFINWKDGVLRHYHPKTENIWVRIPFGSENSPGRYDTLNNNPDFHIVDGRIYCNELSYLYSGNYRVYSKLGINYFVSKDIPVTITCPLVILEHPVDTILACSNAGEILLSAELYGSYTSLHWEYKKLGSTRWESIEGAKDLTLRLYSSTPEELRSISGEYRLRIKTPGVCGSVPLLYTNSSLVLEGYPVTDATISSDYSSSELESLCEGSEVVLRASSDGTATGYIWQKYNDVSGEFEALSSVVNPTVLEKEFKIVSTVREDAGIYRCLVQGPSLCETGSFAISNELTLDITVTAKILEEPESLVVCHGSTHASFVPVISGDVTYQWYKDGHKVPGATNARLSFYHEIVPRFDSLLNKIVYDTTGVQFEDAGLYQLEISYINCAGDLDTMYTREVQLYVSGLTEIVNSTSFIYGFRSGYGILEVEANVLGDDVPLHYQWYRNYSNGYSEKIENGPRFKGATSARLIITSLEDNDFNDLSNSYDYYYCAVTGACNTVLSTGSLIKVVPEIVINTEPYSQEKCLLDDVEFTVDAAPSEVTEPITYQWYKDGIVLKDDSRIKGSKTSKLSISSISTSDIGVYYVDVQYVNLSAGIISTDVTLSVEEPPIIETQPTDIKVDLLTDKEFTLTVKVKDQTPGYLCEYQWYKDGIAIPNATDSYYFVSNAVLSDAGKYYVLITSLRGCGETQSSEVTVDVIDTYLSDYGLSNTLDIISILPSPASYKTLLTYSLSRNDLVTVSILDITGRHLGTLYNGLGIKGNNELTLNLENYISGTYYLLLESNDKRVLRSIIIAK